MIGSTTYIQVDWCPLQTGRLGPTTDRYTHVFLGQLNPPTHVIFRQVFLGPTLELDVVMQ